MRLFCTLFAGVLACVGISAQAEFVLQLPLGAKSTYSKVEPLLSPIVAAAPFRDGLVPFENAPQHIRRSVWRFESEQTLTQVQSGILKQLEGAGYDILLFCQTAECGGFDFRFSIPVVDLPAMFVDLRDFRFISAKQAVSENPSYVTFFLSKSPIAAFVQMTEYTGIASQAEPKIEVPKVTVPSMTESKITGIVGEADEIVTTTFSMVLEGLEFQIGSTKLGADPNGALALLAGVLQADPDLKIVLVGHSDMSGSLAGNISISKRRAQSVLEKLVSDHDIDASRLTAQGVGFLAPRASNDTPEGQQKNRRVEAVFSK